MADHIAAGTGAPETIWPRAVYSADALRETAGFDASRTGLAGRTCSPA